MSPPAATEVATSATLPESARELLAGLNEEQRRAATAVSGPVRILAGAGTGKTRTITHRIAVQIMAGACTHDEVLAVTFTDRAARELRERLRALGLPGPVRTATFHSAAWAQLRYFWPQLSERPRPQVLARKGEVLAPLARRLRVEMRDLAAEIEWAKARLITPEGYPAAIERIGREPPVEPDQLVEAWAAYERAKTDRDLIDYDDMLVRGAEALTGNAEVAAAVRARYRVFTVDEFQDVNPAQWQLLRAWLGDRDELCVVGDDDQTIYRFNGSSPAYLTDFTTTFPHATTVTLTHSYRSTTSVLSLANKVLWTKPRAQRKRLRSTLGDGPAPQLHAFDDDDAERAAVVARVRELLDGGTPPGEIAICYRINSQSADWEEALTAAGIPYLVRGEPGFFAHEAVRQALTVLSEEARARPDGRREDPTRRPDTVPAAPADPAEAVERVLRERAGFRPGSPPAGEVARERHEHLTALVDLARRVAATDPGSSHRPDPGSSLRPNPGEHGFAAVVGDLVDRAAAGQETADPDGAVTLLTLHRAKGLEFDAVFVVACEEGLLPISHAFDDDEAIEDERRLLYVGVTRARRHLWLSWADRRGTRRRRRSRLLTGLAGAREPASSGGPSGGRRRSSAGASTARRSRVCACEAPLVSPDDRSVGRCATCRATDPATDQAIEALKAWRARRAADDGVPAYVVFHDRTLTEIGERCPDSLEALGTVRGVGPAKLERFGPEVLEVLAELRGAHP